MFVPPPTTSERDEIPDGAATIDVLRIRDDEAEDEDRRFQPFPDEFIAAFGERCLWMLDYLRPRVMSCLRQIAKAPIEDRPAAIAAAIRDEAWPTELKVLTLRDLRSAAHNCQMAAIAILSLVLGPRWSEISSLSNDAVRGRASADGPMYFLNGSTFKLSRSMTGEERDWPLHPAIARYVLDQQEYISITEDAGFKWLWRSHRQILGGGEPMRQIDAQLKRFVAHLDLTPLLAGTNCHHHRFRKTTARLIVIALHGGPIVLRRLFGHETLAMTLRYILANNSIVDELREIAESEQKAAVLAYVQERDRLAGGGADNFRAAINRLEEYLDVYVPSGKRDQATTRSAEIVELASAGADGFPIKQILPGLVACFKPRESAGVCCKVGELPNVSLCDSGCAWHLEMPEFLDQARLNVADALTHIENGKASPLIKRHYAEVVRSKMAMFPELEAEFATREGLGQIHEDSNDQKG